MFLRGQAVKRFFLLFFILFTFGTLLFADQQANNKLFFAVQAMNVEKARNAVKAGADVNGVDDDEWPYFITAVSGGNINLIDVFLRNGVKINIAGPDGKTALMHAISSKNKKVTKLLLNYRASLTAKDRTGKNVLMYAAEAGDLDLVNRALKAKANPLDTDSKGMNALNYAMAGRNKQIIKMLGAYETQPHDFIIAVETGNVSKARTLLKKGIDPNLKNESGEPPLFVAIRNNDKAMLKLLLESNADVNFKNSKGYTILMYCIASNKIKLAQELLKYGALGDFNFKYAKGRTALMIAILSKERRFIRSISKFRQNLDITDDAGKTALIYAVHMGLGDVVKDLLEKGADRYIAGKDGKTALDIAEEKDLAYISMLLRK